MPGCRFERKVRGSSSAPMFYIRGGFLWGRLLPLAPDAALAQDEEQ